MAKKKDFLDGYKTYDDSYGHGDPEEWKRIFRLRMGIGEAKAIIRREDPLDVLELPKNPTKSEIKKAFRRKALQWHPDRNKNNEKEATERFRKIHAAYVLLSEDE